MNNFIQTDASKIRYKELSERIRYFKESEEGVSNMCKAMEDMRDKARIEGKIEGKREGISNMIERLKAPGIDENKLRQAAEESM